MHTGHGHNPQSRNVALTLQIIYILRKLHSSNHELDSATRHSIQPAAALASWRGFRGFSPSLSRLPPPPFHQPPEFVNLRYEYNCFFLPLPASFCNFHAGRDEFTSSDSIYTLLQKKARLD